MITESIVIQDKRIRLLILAWIIETDVTNLWNNNYYGENLSNPIKKEACKSLQIMSS